jgi:signal recognition particle GTPase
MRRVIAANAGDDLAAVVTMAWKTGTGMVRGDTAGRRHVTAAFLAYRQLSARTKP